MTQAEGFLVELPTACRLVLGVVLLLSGISKFADLGGFVRVLQDTQVLPARLIGGAAIGIPAAELVLGGWLAVGGRSVTTAAVLAFGLLVVFAATLSVVLVQGRRPECGCFGRLSRRRIGWSTVGRSGGFATMAAVVAVWSPVANPKPGTDWGALVVSAGFAVLGLLVTESIGFIRSAPGRRSVPKAA